MKYFAEAGFDNEWQATSGDRIRRRQIEVQANNPNQPSEYRTVTTPQPRAQTEIDPEERKFFL